MENIHSLRAQVALFEAGRIQFLKWIDGVVLDCTSDALLRTRQRLAQVEASHA